MRLVSKQHDYYDGVISTSVNDKTFTFVREYIKTEFTDCKVHLVYSEYGPKAFIEHIVATGVIGFCGELYPFASVKDIGLSTTQIFYNKEDLIKAYPKIQNTRPMYYGDNFTDVKNWLDKGTIERYWGDNFDLDQSRVKKIFDDYKTAYFVIQYGDIDNKSKRLVLEQYPVLKDYGFGKKYDAYTCFQKIEMYLTNELVKPDEINIIIPDDMKAQAHGYDKMSFRKEKE